jgi:aryl-alcohol dehydrogenase-like predicted oxidoreductase
MKRRRLGGLEVSAIGLGAPIYGEPSADAVIPGVHRALERGVDLIDSSDIYWHGMHEELVGRAIKGRRDQVVLATKFGNIRPPGGTPSADGRPEHVIQACEASLRRLEVDVIDLYYIHRVDPTVPIEACPCAQPLVALPDNPCGEQCFIPAISSSLWVNTAYPVRI